MRLKALDSSTEVLGAESRLRLPTIRRQNATAAGLPKHCPFNASCSACSARQALLTHLRAISMEAGWSDQVAPCEKKRSLRLCQCYVSSAGIMDGKQRRITVNVC